MKKHLLYINLDGFAYYLYSNTPERFPHLRALASSSTFFASCYSSIPSITVPMQVGIVTGKKCGETWNCYQYLNKDSRSIVKTGRFNKSKTVAEHLMMIIYIFSREGMPLVDLRFFKIITSICLFLVIVLILYMIWFSFMLMIWIV